MKRFITLCLLLSSLCQVSVLAQIKRTPIQTKRPNLAPLKIAHRGACKFAPENTLAAVQKAVDLGFDYIELDVQFSRDGVPVIIHDPMVDRTTPKSGFINMYTAAQLQQMDAGSWYSPEFKNEKIPLLEDALKIMKGKACLYWDAKAVPNQKMIDLLKQYNFGRDCVVITVNDQAVKALNTLWPDAPLMPGINKPEDVETQLKKYPNLRAFNSSGPTLDPKAVELAHQKGVMVFTNALEKGETVDTYKRIIWDLGSDGIQGDQLDNILAYLKLSAAAKAKGQGPPKFTPVSPMGKSCPEMGN